MVGALKGGFFSVQVHPTYAPKLSTIKASLRERSRRIVEAQWPLVSCEERPKKQQSKLRFRGGLRGFGFLGLGLRVLVRALGFWGFELNLPHSSSKARIRNLKLNGAQGLRITDWCPLPISLRDAPFFAAVLKPEY